MPGTRQSRARAIRPDVLVKGDSCAPGAIAGGAFVEGYGGRVVLAPVERLLSAVESCRQRGRNVAAYLTECFQARQAGWPIPSPLV